MKKLWLSLLVLALVGGCVQKPQEVKQPEEPVVEEPTTTPEKEEQEQEPEQNTENLVKKIDETKDWVITEATETFNLFPEEEDRVFNDMLATVVPTQGSDFEIWFKTIYTPYPELTLFSVNIDSDDALTVNQTIQELYENKLTRVGHQYLSYRSFVNDEILSVVIKEGSFAIGSTWEGSEFAYHFDLTNGELIDNAELLSRYSLTISDLQNKLLEAYASKDCTVTCDDVSGELCYVNPNRIKEDTLERYVLFVEENELYFMGALQIPGEFGNGMKIKIS